MSATVPHHSSTRPAPGSVFDLIRAFGVVAGGPIVLVALVVACAAFAIVDLAQGDVPSWLALTGLGALATYLLLIRPWTRAWGATPRETAAPLPGDEIVPNAGIQMTRAVTIDAPLHDVWQWLAQIGQDRGGFYSYAWLENLAGCELRNADRIHPDWQHREVGETVLLHPSSGLELARFDVDSAYAFANGWYFALAPLSNGGTRLFARSRVPRGVGSLLYALFIEIPHFVMERRMLLGIKQRAEQHRTIR